MQTRAYEMRKNDLISIKHSKSIFITIHNLLLNVLVTSCWLWYRAPWALPMGSKKRKFPKVWFKDTYQAPADVELNFTAFPNCPIFPLNNDIELRMGEEWLWHDKVGIVPFFAHNLRPLQPVLRSCLHDCYKLLDKIIQLFDIPWPDTYCSFSFLFHLCRKGLLKKNPSFFRNSRS